MAGLVMDLGNHGTGKIKSSKLKAAIRVAVTFATIELHVCNCKIIWVDYPFSREYKFPHIPSRKTYYLIYL
jgi:hypothetical protein